MWRGARGLILLGFIVGAPRFFRQSKLRSWRTRLEVPIVQGDFIYFVGVMLAEGYNV